MPSVGNAMKIEIPIPAVSDILFDSEIQKTEIDKSPGIDPEEIEKINQEARQEYKDQHPTIKEFVEELND